MWVTIILLLTAFVVYYYFFFRHRFRVANWQHYFPNTHYSAKEFFTAVESRIRAHEMPGVTFETITHFEKGVFSARREYLRLSFNSYIMEIGCAPFGKDSFVSWWLNEKYPDFLGRIPFINTLLGKNPFTKSNFQLDTEAMFRTGVHTSVLEVVEEMTKSNGLRSLSESEKQFTDRRKLKM